MNSYSFDERDMEIILNALSYIHWNDRDLTEDDRNYIDGLYQSLEESYSPQ
jgi:hypothetical protein